MSYNATVKFQYVNDTEPSFNKHFPEIVDQMTVNIEAPAHDLNVWQYYELFKSFLRSVGFSDYNIAEGACRLAFNDHNREDDMQKIMKEHDLQDKQLYTDEDYYALQARVDELKDQLDHVSCLANHALQARVDELKDQLDHAEETAMHWKDKYFKAITPHLLDHYSTMPPWGHSDMEALQYTEDEINAMCDAAEAEEKEQCVEMAEREYEWVKWNEVPGSEEACAKGCKCPVMDNAEMPSNKKWVNADCPLHGLPAISSRKTEPLSCDKDDPREECKEHWNDFWEEEGCPPGTVYINGECADL